MNYLIILIVVILIITFFCFKKMYNEKFGYYNGKFIYDNYNYTKIYGMLTNTNKTNIDAKIHINYNLLNNKDYQIMLGTYNNYNKILEFHTQMITYIDKIIPISNDIVNNIANSTIINERNTSLVELIKKIPSPTFGPNLIYTIDYSKVRANLNEVIVNSTRITNTITYIKSNEKILSDNAINVQKVNELNNIIKENKAKIVGNINDYINEVYRQTIQYNENKIKTIPIKSDIIISNIEKQIQKWNNDISTYKNNIITSIKNIVNEKINYEEIFNNTYKDNYNKYMIKLQDDGYCKNLLKYQCTIPKFLEKKYYYLPMFGYDYNKCYNNYKNMNPLCKNQQVVDDPNPT